MTLVRTWKALRHIQCLKDNLLAPRQCAPVFKRGYSMHDPETYETYKAAAERDADEFVPKIIRGMRWKTDEMILDYGCGAGSTGNKFLVPEAEVYNSTIKACDSSEAMIQFAKENNPHHRVSYILGNIMEDNFPLRNMQFDRIFAIFVLHFIKDYRKALRRFFSILKPGGQMGILLATKPEYFDLYKHLGTHEKWSMYMQGYEKYIPEWIEKNLDIETCIREHLKTAGYEILDLQTFARRYQFESLDILSRLFVSGNPFINRVPQPLLEDLREEYKKQILQWTNLMESPDPQKGCTLDYKLLCAIAQKPGKP